MVTSIITPVWNQSDITHQFLYHNWQLYMNRPDIEFVIVDNGSTDNTQAVLKRWHNIMPDRLIVETLPKNTGFGPGNNLGAILANGSILVFLSNDVIPLGDYVTTIEKSMQDQSLMGPQLLNQDTGWNTFNGETIPYLMAWCFACTKSTWQELGGFDEQFVPCDYEDIDLAMVAKQKGIGLIQLSLPIQHIWGQSAKSLDGGREKITLKNQALFKEKWGFN
jgi:GT2 family glycosyltransferase